MLKLTKKIVIFLVNLIISRSYSNKEYVVSPIHLWKTFVLQKVLGFNRSVKWPVHFRSKVTFPDKIRVGNHVNPGLSPGCYIQGNNGIIFGSNIRIGPNVCIISANHDTKDYDKHIDTNPIIIGNNVWIGANSVILPGVNIGDNVIIGAGSVVAKNIPSNVIAAGNPCKVIKKKEPYEGKTYI